VVRLTRSRITVATLVLLAVVAVRPYFARAELEGAEYEIKAAYLFNFARFVTWPATAFPTHDVPFVICVLGPDPFGTTLDQTVAREVVDGRSLHARRIAGPEDSAGCQIVFVGTGAGSEADLPEALRDRPILTVGDGDAFARKGGTIGFRFEDNTVRLTVNPDALKRAGLAMSSQLLRVANLVPGAP
jgi:hypothetical protein